MSLGENIKKGRMKKGITLLELAEAIGVREATVQRYESGSIKNIKHDTIVKISNALNTTPAALMGWNEIKDTFSTNISKEPDSESKNLTDDQKWLFSSIAKADPKTASKIRKLMEIIDEEERNNNY